jgi:hypothetical protein
MCPLRGRQCLPETGELIVSTAACSVRGPNLVSHNHGTAPNFDRKDLVLRHLRLVHYVETLILVDLWKDEGPLVSSRCWFRSGKMQTW